MNYHVCIICRNYIRNNLKTICNVYEEIGIKIKDVLNDLNYKVNKGINKFINFKQ